MWTRGPTGVADCRVDRLPAPCPSITIAGPTLPSLTLLYTFAVADWPRGLMLSTNPVPWIISHNFTELTQIFSSWIWRYQPLQKNEASEETCCRSQIFGGNVLMQIRSKWLVQVWEDGVGGRAGESKECKLWSQAKDMPCSPVQCPAPTPNHTISLRALIRSKKIRKLEN
jgi:hypothetical protein